MGDSQYENEYMEKKKRLRALHKRLRDTKEVQEIYHRIMGSSQGETDLDSKNSETK